MALVYLLFTPKEIIGSKNILSVLEVKLSESLSQKEWSLPPPCSFWRESRRGVGDSEEQPGQELMKQLHSAEGRQEQPRECRGRNSEFPLCVLHFLALSVPAPTSVGSWCGWQKSRECVCWNLRPAVAGKGTLGCKSRHLVVSAPLCSKTGV